MEPSKGQSCNSGHRTHVPKDRRHGTVLKIPVLMHLATGQRILVYIQIVQDCSRLGNYYYIG